MRKLRFRYWDTWDKKMVSFTLADIANGFDCGYGMGSFPDTKGYPGGSDDEEKLEDLTIEQWTGLTDKKGKDIYEGDIIRWDEKHTGGVEAVQWFNQDGAWSCKGRDKDDCGSWLGGNEHICEVIGNVHENPELLEKQCDVT